MANAGVIVNVTVATLIKTSLDPSMLTEEKKSRNSWADCFSSTETIRGQISTRSGVIAR